MLLISFRPHSSRLRVSRWRPEPLTKYHLLCVCVCVYSSNLKADSNLRHLRNQIKLARLLTCGYVLALESERGLLCSPSKYWSICLESSCCDLMKPTSEVGLKPENIFINSSAFWFFSPYCLWLITLIFNHRHFMLYRLPFVEQRLSFCELFIMKYNFHGQILAYST